MPWFGNHFWLSTYVKSALCVSQNHLKERVCKSTCFKKLTFCSSPFGVASVPTRFITIRCYFADTANIPRARQNTYYYNATTLIAQDFFIIFLIYFSSVYHIM